MRLLRGSIDEQRVVIQGMAAEQTRFTGWMVERMNEILEDRGLRYQSYDRPIVTDTHVCYQRRVRARTDGASTPVPPTDDQPAP